MHGHLQRVPPLMLLEIYKQTYAPRVFDVLLNKNGTVAVLNPRALTGAHLRVVLEDAKPQPTPTPHQIVSIYAMISRYQMCEVALYGVDH
ncbi:hypothetical protein [Rhizobium ruizarguesonis]|uniref:hypothetical protein n=1 Tax=Rhizobium ruizarguesonis TaxID=2081791 RepID=UPI001FEDC542|nr:hypothetical protein [Rhizobium ruizarguesonis]